MERKNIIYLFLGLAVLIGVVYLLKYSGKKKNESKSDEEQGEALSEETNKGPAKGEQESSGVDPEDEPKAEETAGKYPPTNGERPALLEEQKEDIEDDSVVCKPGEKSETVKELQRRLKGYDIDVNVTGIYDEQTKEALSHMGLEGEVSLFDVPEIKEEEA